MAATNFYEENILNKFANYTYNWKIHMVHPAEATKFDDNIKADRTIVLADSGVETEINIDSVEQNMVLAFSKADRNSVANQFNIRLVEPGGVTLFNRILFAARKLDIENHLKATYLLELNFKGYTDDGVAVSNIIGPYYYSCILTDLTLDYRDGGTTYVGNFIEVENDAYSKVSLHLPTDIDVEASTYGAFLLAFQEKVQEQESNRVAASTSQIFPNRYEFLLDQEVSHWGDWEFGATQGIDDQTGTRAISVSGNGTLKFNFPQGTSIVAALATALYQTTEFQKLPIFDGSSGKQNPEDGTARPENLSKLSSWMKLATDVTYQNYDPLRKHYQKFIKYTVGQYITPELIHDPVSYLELYKTKTLQQERLKNIVRNGLLRKKFDYTYTGLNTEVLNLDIQLNNTYYQLQALNHGALQYSDQLFAKINSRLQPVADQIGTLNEIKGKIDKANAQKSKLELELGKLSDHPLHRNQSLADRLLNDIAIIDATTERLRQEEARVTEERSELSEQFLKDNQVTPRIQRLQNRYITQSDVVSTAAVDRAFEEADDLPLTFIANAVNSKATAGPDKGDSVGTVMLGAVEINLNSLADLATMIITVRGDPYWLGKPKGASNRNIQNNAEYTRGGNSFFLDLNFPTYPEDNTGLVNIPEKDFGITGLYRVTQVQARYQDGQFIMMLDTFRDTNANVGLLLSELTSGQIDLNEYNQLADRYVNEEQGDGGSEGSTTSTPSGSGVGEFENGTGSGVVTQAQSGIRNQAVDPSVVRILETAGINSGVNVVVTSGGQPSSGPNRTGSHRHDNGMAADVQLFVPGRSTPLNINNPNDLPIIQNFINQSRLAGATGIGAGNGYMGDNTFHIDRSYPERGYTQYWGGPLDNGTFRSRNAPKWLADIAQGRA